MIKTICKAYFKLTGWTYVSCVPKDLKKFVLVAAPHTSNWDFMLAMSFFSLSGYQGKFIIKKEWLKFPFKRIFESLGAIGVDREAIIQGKHQNLTDHMAALITDSEEFVMLVTPEGTRKPKSKWKRGFYYMAEKAEVPIVLAYGDYKTKTLGLGLVLYPTDYKKDMRTIMEFYNKVTPKHAQNYLPDKRFVGVESDE